MMAANGRNSRIRLSSSFTFGTRFILVPLSLFLCVMFVVFSFIEVGTDWYVVLPIFILAVALFPVISSMWRLCEVEADDRGLWVKRGRQADFVPFENVVKVTSGSFDAFAKIQVTTRGTFVFGDTFTFMPIITSRFSPGTPTARWLEEKVRETRLV